VLRLAGVRRVRRRRIERRAPEPLARLTPRECEVLFELARGRTNKQIARTLSLSPRTVGNHVSAILSKLGCATRTEASRLVPAVQAQAS
jgi:DNA-binding NarL/FixJ family response regulator